ncbi:alpha/beta hydrolase [Actinoplanes sp. CA-142083]|uniref:alpha/beta hydrolase n=1 Tax=Actinoplanes sp. CA-142083 TaxID=3239903 RepID=UPI003D8E6A21
MPIGYAIPVALLAFCTATAIVAPRPPHTTPSHWSFWVTLQINELPFVGIYILVAISALAFAQGDLDSPGGLEVLGFAVLTVVGLAVLIERALRTPAAFGLTFGRRPWAHILLAPTVKRRRDVALVRNIPYGDAGKHNLLDVYHRRDRRGGGPVLVFFHGGGFRMGSKNREARAMLNQLAARGWVCVNANYRLAPASFPDHHVDGKKVVAWVRSHIGEYGGDPRTIIASGSSAGGHMAAMLALTPNDPAFQPGFEGENTAIDAAIGFGGYYGRIAGPGSSPLDHIGEAPPFLVVHGANDSLTLVEDARDFAGRLRAASSQPVRYVELPGGQHGFDLYYSLRYSYVIEAVAAFGESVRQPPSS